MGAFFAAVLRWLILIIMAFIVIICLAYFVSIICAFFKNDKKSSQRVQKRKKELEESIRHTESKPYDFINFENLEK